MRSAQVKELLQIIIILVQWLTFSQVKHASHSPKVEKTYILTKLILNVPTNRPIALSDQYIFFKITNYNVYAAVVNCLLSFSQKFQCDDKKFELFGEGLLWMGPTPSSLLTSACLSTDKHTCAVEFRLESSRAVQYSTCCYLWEILGHLPTPVNLAVKCMLATP